MIKTLWLWTAIVLGTIAVLQPELIILIGGYLELQLKKLWLLFRLYPQIQIYRLQMKFLLWRQRHNKGNSNNL